MSVDGTVLEGFASGNHAPLRVFTPSGDGVMVQTGHGGAGLHTFDPTHGEGPDDDENLETQDPTGPGKGTHGNAVSPKNGPEDSSELAEHILTNHNNTIWGWGISIVVRIMNPGVPEGTLNSHDRCYNSAAGGYGGPPKGAAGSPSGSAGG